MKDKSDKIEKGTYHQDVGWFDVSVQGLVEVQVAQAPEDLIDDSSEVSLGHNYIRVF